MDLYLAIAVAIIAYVAIITLFPKIVPDDSKRYTRTALERIYRETQDVGLTERSGVLKDSLREESGLIRWFFGLGFMQPLYDLGIQSGYKNNLKGFITLIAMSAAAAFLIATVLGLGIMAIPVAAIGGYYYPYQRCRKKIRKRQLDFLNQFPEALDMIVRSVRSGFPVNAALQMVGDTAEEPIRSEFRQMCDEIIAGRSMQQVLSRLAARINQQDVRFFAVVLSVQQETGGNLAEIIGNLAGILRKRKQLRLKIHAITSEGRATGLVLGALPVLVFGAIYVAQPDYLKPFFTTGAGNMMLGVVIGLLVTCYVVVKQMIKVDI